MEQEQAPASFDNFDRGYTGHEHLSGVDIIHMNGRVYSAELSKMMSSDPVTAEPDNGRNYNRYTYAYNNSLRYIDLTGYTARDGDGLDEGERVPNRYFPDCTNVFHDDFYSETRNGIPAYLTWIEHSVNRYWDSIIAEIARKYGIDVPQVDDQNTENSETEEDSITLGSEGGDWTENWFGQGNHTYDRLFPAVCDASQRGCTLESIVNALNTKGVHPNQSSAFVPGEEYIADVNIPGPFGEDHIRTTAVYNSDGVQIGIRNETMMDHALHPGVVERTVVLQDGSYYIQTQGGGYGYMGGPNIWLDDLVLGAVDQAVIDRF